jgi:GDP-4-dehydro-6-deoxy-D-mannose reductase
LFTSTAHVYAPVTFDAPFVDETAAVSPRSGYGKSKLAAEEIMLRLVRERRGDAVIARVFKHAGARQTSRLMLPQWAEQLARQTTDPVRVYSLQSFLDLSDVRDVSRAYRLLMEKGAAGEIYNVGSGINRSSGEILDEMRRVAGNTRAVIEIKPARRQEPIADIRKITTTCGWRPMVTLEQTVRDVLEYWQQKESRAAG